MKWILHFILSAAAVLLWANLIPGITIASFGVALIAVLIMGALNLIVRPILFLLTLPLTILTLGLFLIVLNVIMIWLAAWITPGFDIEGFLPALIFGVLMAITNAGIDRALQGGEA